MASSIETIKSRQIDLHSTREMFFDKINVPRWK